jgi:alkylhydroperoxidase/carboxymuconolactone decarboxylase family protein YurZ
MTTPKAGSWQATLQKHTPELAKAVKSLDEFAMADGALSQKTKVLMMMLCDSLLAHSDGAAGLSMRARSLGASEAEIAETLAVAFLMGGLPGVVTGTNAFRD